MLRFTNTLTRKKEPFQPLNPPKVTLYVCGVTVYDRAHIGHARGAVVFDTLRRYLEHRGFQVVHVRNITDVDDKIIDRAREEKKLEGDLKSKAHAVAERYTASFQKDFALLNLLLPTHEPKATKSIPKMIQFIQGLVGQKQAYEGKDGVYFSVRKLRDYGALSHQKPDQMLEGTRIEPGEGKRDPLDFALWKKAKPEEPAWESPWGLGRPGWHIECSAMSTDLLGGTFDIHGGGQDLIFPHHENERAQALGAKMPFARSWLHNGLLSVEGQKMSKSLGNIVTISQAVERHNADVLRLFFLSAHYRSPVDFGWDRLDEAARGYEKFTTFFAHAEAVQANGDPSAPKVPEIQAAQEAFYAQMDDDLNTPRALACLYDLVEQGYRWKAQGKGAQMAAAKQKLLELGGVLGLFQGPAEASDPVIQRLVEERDKARANKDYAKADQIRKQLMDQGYVVEDTSGKTVVRKHA